MKSQALKELSLCYVFRKTKLQNLKKMQNTLLFGPFNPNLGKTNFAQKLRSVAFSHLSSPNFMHKIRKS